MRKYGLPFLILLLGSFGLQLVREYVYVSFKETLLAILTALLLFIFGASLNDHKKTRNDTWLKKMLIMFVYIAFILIYLNVIRIDAISVAMATIGFTNVIYYMLFIYFGYIFFS